MATATQAISTASITKLELTPRKNTRGFAQVPNTVVENMALLTHAELALLLAVARRGPSCSITDEAWQKWTGLKARAKEYAITGLRDKGLTVEGRGNNAKYSIHWNAWHKFVLRATPPEIEKPRTKGRAVKATPGMKVHEECAATGCAKLCGGSCDGKVLELPVAQPVAQVPSDGSSVPPSSLPVVNPSKNPQPVARSGARGSAVKRQDKQPIAQPVARSSEYPATLKSIQKRFPTASPAFCDRLLERVHEICGVVPGDADLARLVGVASKRNQYSEGLYLETVPAVVTVWALELHKQETPSASLKTWAAAAVASLKELASREALFAGACRWGVSQLSGDVDTLPKTELVARCAEINQRLSSVALDKFKSAPEYASELKSLEESAKRMGLNESEADEHIKSHLEVYAFSAYSVPYVHPSY